MDDEKTFSLKLNPWQRDRLRVMVKASLGVAHSNRQDVGLSAERHVALRTEIDQLEDVLTQLKS